MFPGANGHARRVADMVREWIPYVRNALSAAEQNLAPHIRGNQGLYEALALLIRSRIERRDHLPVPSEPLECKSHLERNAELRWLLSRLDRIYHSPVNQGADGRGEQPAD